MQTLGPLPFAIIAALSGAMIPLQAGMNARLGQALGHPIWATLVSLAVSVACASAVAVSLRPAAPAVAGAFAGPWWIWLGGVIGVFYITVALLIAPKLGAASFVTAIVAGQMLASVAIDQFGIAGFEQRATSPGRLLGAALVVVGVILMQAATDAPPSRPRQAESPTQES